MTQTNEGAGVTLLAQTPGMTVMVVLDTHSVELDGDALRHRATLRIDQGLPIQPSRWDTPAGEHHRQGTLIVPTTMPDDEGRGPHH